MRKATTGISRGSNGPGEAGDDHLHTVGPTLQAVNYSGFFREITEHYLMLSKIEEKDFLARICFHDNWTILLV